MADTLILVEGQEDIQILKSKINATTKIITFDFQAHRKLNQEGINHELVETYFDQNDISKIDNQAVELTTNWYKNNEVIQYLEFQGLNFGYLLEMELLRYFFLHLKRMQGIINVIKKEDPKKIYCCFLGNLVKEICKKGKTIIVETFQQGINPALHFDTIEIPLEIKGRIFSVKISRKYYLILKNNIENLVNFIFNFKPNMKKIKNDGSILLLDFNPMLYGYLLKSLSKSKKEILLLNQRRPATWNFKSLNLMRNSKCKILKLDKVKGSNISEEQNKIKEKLNSVWSSKQLAFENIFSIDGISFWNAIKDNFTDIINKRAQEFVKNFFLVQFLFENIQISSILEWAHTAPEERIVVFIASRMKIPIVLLQHALYPQNEKFDMYKPILPIIPTGNVKTAVWGNIMKEYLLQHEVNHHDVYVSGSPRHDGFFKNQSNRLNNDTILLAGNSLFYNNFDGTDSRSYEFLELCVRKICDLVKKYPDKKLIVKLFASKIEDDMAALVRKIEPKTPIFQQQNILELIESCDCVISLNYSTVLLDAMILNKPTLVILPEKQHYEVENPVKMNATLHVSNILDLERKFDDLISNEKIRTELLQKGKQFVETYMENRGTASEQIYKILNSF